MIEDPKRLERAVLKGIAEARIDPLEFLFRKSSIREYVAFIDVTLITFDSLHKLLSIIREAGYTVDAGQMRSRVQKMSSIVKIVLWFGAPTR